MITEAEYLQAVKIVKDYKKQITYQTPLELIEYFNKAYASAETRIIDIDCSVRTRNVLYGAGFRTLGDLQVFPRKKIMGLRNCGHASMMEIDKILLQAGITLEP